MLTMKFSFSLFVFAAVLSMYKADDFVYTYENQAEWYDIKGAECILDCQSPIELSSTEAFKLHGIPAIVFKNYNVSYTKPAILSNNGHSANILLPKHINSPVILGGPLQNCHYIAEGIHFHWGSRNAHGSEHVIDSKRFSMEMHIVHRNSKYDTIDEALQHKDGLAVLAIFYQVEQSQYSDFKGLNKIVNSLAFIKKFNQSIKINKFKLLDLLGDIKTSEFYTYQGSLTTPPCSQAVTWIVFANVINISSNQMNAFRLLTDNHGEILKNNYRHLQAKGTRPVYLCQ